MRVRIQNNGLPGVATKITNAETGESLTYLRVDEIHIEMNERPHAILHCQKPVLDIVADAKIEQQVCPGCGRPWRSAQEEKGQWESDVLTALYEAIAKMVEKFESES